MIKRTVIQAVVGIATAVVLVLLMACSAQPEPMTTREANAYFTETMRTLEPSFEGVPDRLLYELGHSVCDVYDTMPEAKAEAALVAGAVEQGYSEEFADAMIGAATHAYCPKYS